MNGCGYWTLLMDPKAPQLREETASASLLGWPRNKVHMISAGGCLPNLDQTILEYRHQERFSDFSTVDPHVQRPNTRMQTLQMSCE